MAETGDVKPGIYLTNCPIAPVSTQAGGENPKRLILFVQSKVLSYAEHIFISQARVFPYSAEHRQPRSILKAG